MKILVFLAVIIVVLAGACKKEEPAPPASSSTGGPNTSSSYPFLGGNLMGRWSANILEEQTFTNGYMMQVDTQQIPLGLEMVEFYSDSTYLLWSGGFPDDSGTFYVQANKLFIPNASFEAFYTAGGNNLVWAQDDTIVSGQTTTVYRHMVRLIRY